MGNWRMEVGRMFIYVMFPVVMFHYFNQPKYFEEWVVKTKQQLYPPEEDQKDFREALQQFKETQQVSYMKAMEERRV